MCYHWSHNTYFSKLLFLDQPILYNREWRPPQTMKRCCGNIVTETLLPEMFSCLRTRVCCRGKNVCECFQKHLLPWQMFPHLCSKEAKLFLCLLLICAPKKHFGKECFCSNVSSFAGALRDAKLCCLTISHTY